MTEIRLEPIGQVVSRLIDLASAPRQPDEGAPEATLDLDERFRAALDGVRPGDALVVLTWLDRASRETLAVHPRGDTTRPVTGVFATRSPDRPNPIGLHDVVVVAVDGTLVHVANLEAINGTPILDLKPVLTPER